ncbi:MAG TPA: SUMF1/EgtB/PvdO family nonheme iron enzyme [Phototrophicaceae bacterium]|nr:SUMF1/EgtB/PvdO family nonheme iron enzyme [Phototrophicaceae bacterium]
MTAEITPLLIFISYAHADREFVKRLTDDLEATGLKIWIDHQGLKPGTRNWEDKLRETIRVASAVLLIASPASRRSNYVQDELAIAEMYNRPVFPIWADGEQWMDCIPLGWGKTHYIDARHNQYPLALPLIIKVLSKSDTQTVKRVEPQSELPTNFVPRNPYKGLNPFREQDRSDFFGREKFVDTLLRALDTATTGDHLLAIVGPSGSGKSSVVMAGILPKLRSGSLSGSQNWIYLDSIVPGKDPLEALQMTFASAMPKRSHRTILDDLTDADGRGLHLMAGQIAPQANQYVVLFIDQFEELFIQTTDEEKRKQFVSLLVNAITEPVGKLLVILTLRADFYDRPMKSYPELATLIQNHQPVLPMTLDDLRAVLERPAALPDTQLVFEDGLIGDILFELRNQAAGLPLLQFTLDKLFDRRNGQTLTLAAYNAIGGVRGALAKHAGETYKKLPSEAHQRLARVLFLRLIEPGSIEQDTTRRRATLNQLTLPDPMQTAIMQAVINTFADARLLIIDQNTIEVSHETLIREWELLGEWLKTARDDIIVQKNVIEDTAEWIKQGRDPDSDILYRGTVLDGKIAWVQRNSPSIEETEFINACIAAWERQQQQEQDQKQRELELAQQNAENARRAELAEKRLREVAETQASEAKQEAEDAKAQAIMSGKRTRQFQVASAFLAIGVVLGLVATLMVASTAIRAISEQQTAVFGANTARTQVADANSTLTSVNITYMAGNTKVAIAEYDRATADAQTTYSSVELARISTLAPGIGGLPPTPVIPLSRLDFYGTVTQATVLAEWEPVTQEFEDEVSMVEVPAGCFYLGSFAYTSANPVNEVCFHHPFWIDKFEVTNGQFNRLNGEAASGAFTGAQQPRDSITWVEARKFCKNQRHARLPTEAEWEYAAGGPNSPAYPFGNTFDSDKVVYSENSNGHSADVGSRPGGASWVGALDMSGNLWEWTNSIYNQENFPYPYQTDDGRENSDSLDFARVLRGGSWVNANSGNLRIANRLADLSDLPAIQHNVVGFRCAREFE